MDIADETREINKAILTLKNRQADYIYSVNQTGDSNPLVIFYQLICQFTTLDRSGLGSATKLTYKKYLYIFFITVTELCNKFNQAYSNKSPFYVKCRNDSVQLDSGIFCVDITSDSVHGECTVSYYLPDPDHLNNSTLDNLMNSILNASEYRWMLSSTVTGGSSIALATLKASLQTFISQNYFNIK